MTAIVLVLPVLSRRTYSDPSWCEQHDREREAAMMNELVPPPRTRPSVVTGQMSTFQRPEGE